VSGRGGFCFVGKEKVCVFRSSCGGLLLLFFPLFLLSWDQGFRFRE
jgi:hypothetical protein